MNNPIGIFEYVFMSMYARVYVFIYIYIVYEYASTQIGH